jgi:hypothetical protein
MIAIIHSNSIYYPEHNKESNQSTKKHSNANYS